MLTKLQKATAQAMVSIFETGKVEGTGKYATVVTIPGDTGGLSYGRMQASLMSGNLYLLIQAYCDADGAYEAQLTPYLARMKAESSSLNNDATLKSILKQAGSDPIMHDVQDQFADRAFWNPAVNAADNLGLTLPLSVAVVYDSFIHGGWKAMRDRTNALGSVSAVGEKQWVKNYVKTRRNWLATHSNTLLHNTVYRMDEMQKQINNDNWSLSLPMVVRGVKITADILPLDDQTADSQIDNTQPPLATANDTKVRLLFLDNPNMTGDDVKALQDALLAKGYKLGNDGIFGPGTDKAVKAFQTARGLKADGIVGPVTRNLLGLD